MKIDSKILSIPPYISTDWSQVRAIYMKEDRLCVALVEGDTIEVPGLDEPSIKKIFDSHAEFVDEIYKQSASENPAHPPFPFFPGMGGQNEGSSFQMSFGPGGEAWGNVMHHNPDQAHLPNLPKEVIQKITSITKVIIPEDLVSLTRPEPHCNCVHCQIVRAMNGEDLNEPEEIEEEVSEEELQFTQWSVEEISENIYSVKNKLDTDENYQVCLKPVGCTCGRENCVHIISVLES